MRNNGIIDRYGTMDPNLLAKLDECQKQADCALFRMIKCPVCGYNLVDVYGREHYLIRVKCRKCKFNEVIDTAMFRTVRRRYYCQNNRRYYYPLR